MATKTRIDDERLKTEFGIIVTSEFVPYSKSRSYKPDARTSEKSLNWKVTLKRCATMPFAPEHNFREIITTDYMAGCGHCPSYKQNARWTQEYSALIDHETEKGFQAKSLGYMSHVVNATRESKSIPIMPGAANVLYSLLMDAYAIDYATFEDWAGDYGYSTDSRQGEQIYRACLEIGLRLRAGLGEELLAKLREEFQDF